MSHSSSRLIRRIVVDCNSRLNLFRCLVLVVAALDVNVEADLDARGEVPQNEPATNVDNNEPPAIVGLMYVM